MPPKEIPHFDLREVERLQAELLRTVDELGREPDRDRAQALVKRLGAQSAELERVCGDLEARARAAESEIHGEIEVVLTADQRAIVKQRTGVDLEVVILRDDGGGLVGAMPHMSRDQVLSYAIEEAEQRQRRAAAQDVARTEFDRIANDLRRDASKDVRLEIDRLLSDPEFRRAFEPKRAK